MRRRRRCARHEIYISQPRSALWPVALRLALPRSLRLLTHESHAGLPRTLRVRFALAWPLPIPPSRPAPFSHPIASAARPGPSCILPLTAPAATCHPVEAALGMSKEEFLKLAKWKRDGAKKKAGIF